MNITLAAVICGLVIAGLVIGVPVAVLLWDRRTGAYASAAVWDDPEPMPGDTPRRHAGA